MKIVSKFKVVNGHEHNNNQVRYLTLSLKSHVERDHSSIAIKQHNSSFLEKTEHVFIRESQEVSVIKMGLTHKLLFDINV